MASIYVIRDRQCEVVEVGLELTIGRGYANRLRLEGSDVSRAHAIIYTRGEKTLIQDLDSKNGVRVNGQRVSKKILKPGDEIHVSKFVLLFEPAEPVDLSAWLNEDEDGDTHGTANDRMIQKRHQHCQVGLLEKSFASSQTSDEMTIARAGSALRFARQAISRLSQTFDHTRIYQEALDWAVECFAAQRGFVAIRDASGRLPQTVAMFDVKKRDKIEVHHRILEWLFEQGDAVISVEPVDAPSDTEGKDKSHRIGVPIIVRGKPYGFIYLENDPPIPPFTVDDLQQLYCIAVATSQRLEQVEHESAALVGDE